MKYFKILHLQAQKTNTNNYKEQVVKYNFKESIIKRCYKIKLKKIVIYKNVSINWKIKFLEFI